MMRMSLSTSRRNAPASARTCAMAVIGFVTFFSASANAGTGSAYIDKGSVRTSAHSDLMVLGPVEALDREQETLRVLGQVVQTADAGTLSTQISVGSVVAVSGELASDGAIRARRVAKVASEYVAGSTRIAVRGKVLAMNARLGNLKLGQLFVDYTASLYSLDQADLNDGAVLFVAGTQPVPGGVFVADEALASAPVGADTMKRSIGGSDLMKRSIGGSDLANAVTTETH